MADALSLVYRNPGRPGDGTGAAAIFPKDEKTLTDTYLDFFEKERARKAKAAEDKNFTIPETFGGLDTQLDQAFDTDKPELAKGLEDLHTRDIQLTMARKAGKLDNQQYMHGKTELQNAKYQWLVKASTSALQRKRWEPLYTDARNHPENYDPETLKKIYEHPFTPPKDRSFLNDVQQLSEVNTTSYLTPKNSVTEVKTGTIDPNTGIKATEDIQYIDPVRLQVEAETKAKDTDKFGYAEKKKFVQQNPNESYSTANENNPKYVDFIKKEMLSQGKYRLFTKRDVQRAPSGSGFGGDGTGGNDRYSVTKIPENTVREKETPSGSRSDEIVMPGEYFDFGGGFDLSPKIYSDKSAGQNWTASKYLTKNPDNGKFEEKTNFNGIAVLESVVPRKKDGKWYAVLSVPAHKEDVKTKGIFGTTTKQTDVPQQTIYVPYETQASKIEGITVDSKGNNGWVLPGSKRTNVKGENKATNITQSNPDDQIINSTLDFENKRGYKNFGFTSHSGTLNKQQALEKAKKEYLPMVEDLPAPLKAVGFDFAFNSENPRASLMVAAGIIDADAKKQLYKNGKLDQAQVNDLWENGGEDDIPLRDKVLKKYNENPRAFLDKFDTERKRSYDNTNGADVKGNEWYERVAESRKVADKLLNQKSASSKSNITKSDYAKLKPGDKYYWDGEEHTKE